MSIILTTRDGVQFLHSSLIPVPHAFSTRIGGVSSEPHLAGLNFGYNIGDDAETVDENHRRFAAATGINLPIVRGHQVHGVRVVTVDKIPEITTERYGQTNANIGDCDGLVTRQVGITLSVRIADCVPVLMHDPAAKVIGAFHAGWRGAVGGILAEGIAAMEDLGAKAENIHAAIGPCIGVCCYEVGDDFIQAYTAALGSEFAQRYIINRHADLVKTCFALLEKPGIPTANIDVANECTMCNPTQYYSHRTSGTKRGTMIAAIML